MDSCCCGLGEGCLTPVMPGYGKPSGVMIVGQGPGGHEDLEGRPFIGKAGKLLRTMLSDAGIAPEDCFYTNATRCRTPRDRKPTPQEVAACRENLYAEIRSTQPSVILALGDSALLALCKKSGVTGKRGNPIPLHADAQYVCDVWPTYHPAYVLRVPTTRDTVVGDFRKCRDRGKPEDAVSWQWVGGGDNRGIILRAGWPRYNPYGDPEVVAWDIETDYDKAVKGSGKTITQMAATGNGPVSVFRENLPVGFDGGGTFVTHNGWSFDVPIMRASGRASAPWGRDTMIMAYLDDETQPLGLEACAVKYCGARGWKEGQTAPLGSDEFALYNARDAYWTLQLYSELCEKLGDRIKIADRIILPAYLALRKASERGIWIDHALADQFIGAEAAKLSAALLELGCNPNSPKQVLAAFEKLGIRLLNTDKSTLQDLVRLGFPSEADLAKGILGARAATKALAALHSYNAMDRVHNEYLLWRTLTGRSSSRHPNTQNLHRRFTKIFSAPPGSVRLGADYSAVEFRLAAWVANERSILERFQDNPRWDPHRYFAGLFYEKPEDKITDEQRQIAKSANFSQLYLGTASTIKEYAARMDIHLEWEFCQALHDEWHRAFPGFQHMYDRVRDEIRTKGYVETCTGRRRHFGDPSLLNWKSFEEAVRQGANMLVQSPAFDLAAVALGELDKEGEPLTDFTHDSVAEEILDDPATICRSKVLLESVMVERAPRILQEEFGVDLSTIPLCVDFKETRSL